MKFKYSLIFLLVGAICGSYFLGYTPLLLGLAIVMVSLVAFYMYGKDKKAAKEGAWRVPENTLHMLALIGGWPGAMIAQERFRHKTKKGSFLLVFWVTVTANLVGVSWLHTESGVAKLRPAVSQFRAFVGPKIENGPMKQVFFVLTDFRAL
uniref:DUF1294 domain-containing protein n=1 Tax=Microbulbifer agarilyticus TaxID=260552 RepID=UPI000255B920|nr:DUF1294 domain-containing protein [Microbulbifer agarilyticus]